MNVKRKVGIFGGTFDPIHIGHLAAAQDAAHALGLETVLFVPNRVPPHKQHVHVSSMQDRLAMVQMAVADNSLFELSTVELDRPGPSFTIDTMRELRRTRGETEQLFFLTGCDALAELHTWREPYLLLDEFQVVVMDRPTGRSLAWAEVERHFPGIREQVQTVHVAQFEVSSDEIRRRIRLNFPIKYYVISEVEEYIRRHGLYSRDFPSG